MVKKKKRKVLSTNLKSDYLSSVVNLHINHQVILAQKTTFLVAVSALILTMVLSFFFSSYFLAVPLLIQIGLVFLALGSSFSIIMSISIEMVSPVKKVKSFHPLSLDKFHDEAKKIFFNDLIKTCKSDKKMLEDYSDQILEMKEHIVRQTSKITWAIYFLTVPLFLITAFACIQLYLLIF